MGLKKKDVDIDIITEMKVKIVPRSSRNQIVGKESGVYKIKVMSPPVDNKANKNLIELLSKKLGIAKSKIEITAGEHSRSKTLGIKGRSPDEVDSLILGLP